MSESAFLLAPDDNLEWLLIASASWSYPVFLRLQEEICPPLKVPGTRAYRPDFVNHDYNELWRVTADYWRTLSGEPMARHRLRPIPTLWRVSLHQAGLPTDSGDGARLWETLQDFWKLTDAPLDLPALEARMQTNTFMTWRVQAASRSGHRQILQELQANQAHDPQTLLAAAHEVRSAGLLVGRSYDCQVLDFFDGDMAPQGPSIPTGVQSLDQALGGGWPSNAAVLVASFTGGGKSCAAAQMGLEALRKKINTLLITTEISMPEYLTRMVSNQASYEMGKLQEWRVKSYERAQSNGSRRYLPDELLQDPVRMAAVGKLKTLVQQHLRIEDWTQRTGATVEDSLEAQVELLIESGFRPAYLIFDWLKPSVIKVGGKQSDWQGWEKASEAFVRVLKKYRMAGVLFAQAANHPKQGSISHVQVSHLAHSRKMADFMSVFLGISAITVMTPPPPGAAVSSKGQNTLAPVQHWNLAKCRDFPTQNYMVSAQFNFQRFVKYP